MGSGSASVAYVVLYEENTSLRRVNKVLGETSSEVLGAYLKEQGKPAEEIARFEAKFDELRKATGHRTRSRSEGGLSVA